ncbi:Lcl C-terminal domain-containing protein [Psychrobacter sp. I-STPA10]|uniref:Lcl C-terminal domain-containing protein n=1 Tax=Psychrobacter sp. I-STPA10 TaxID=2585769 RepID=UPI001E28823C|nr:DUF1566 domain-containing protein [Psychrobacter sp. I-STPA10]
MSWQKLKPITLAVSTAMMLSACGGGEGGSKDSIEPPVAQEAKIDMADGIKVIEKTDVKNIKQVDYQDNGKINLTIAANNTIAKTQQGDVVLLSQQDNQHLEQIIVIEKKQQQANGDIVITTRPATPNEAFDKLQLSVDTANLTPTVQGIILPNGQMIDPNNTRTINTNNMQIALLPTVKAVGSNEGGWKMNISYNPITAKRTAGMTDEQFDKATIECQKRIDLYSANKEWVDNFCITGVKFSGDIDYKAPSIQSNLDMEKDPNLKDFVFKSTDLNYMKLNRAMLSADLKVDLISNGVAASDFASQAHKDLYRQFEHKSFGSPEDLLYAKLSGLSAEDKKGKFPVFGVVVGTSVPGHIGIANKDTVKLASMTIGSVMWVYVISDFSIDGKVTTKISLEPTYIDIGLQRQANQEWQTITDFTNKNTGQKGLDARFTVESSAQIENIGGVAVEGDLFLAGVRLMNMGVSPQFIVNGKVDGEVHLSTLAPHLAGQVCIKDTGIGMGIKRYFDLDITGNFKAGKGWFKVEGGAGVKYKYQKPINPLDNQEADGLWATYAIDDQCLTPIKPMPSFQEITYANDPQNKIMDKVLANIKVANASKGSVKSWQLSYVANGQTHHLAVKPNASGVLELLQNNEFGNKYIWLPKNTNKLILSAVDYLNAKGSVEKIISLPNYGITTVNINPTQPTIGSKYQIIIMGTHLTTDKGQAFIIDGCQQQRRISTTATKHIYQCTAPTIAFSQLLTIKTPDGKTELFTTGVDVTDNTLPNPNPSPNPTPIPSGQSKLTATGITWCGNADKNMLECSLQALGKNWYGLRQDGEVQAGKKMSYTTLNRNRSECVRDNVTGFIWEQKTNDGGLRDRNHQYTWYNPDPKTNGGAVGYQDKHEVSSSQNLPYGQACNNTLAKCNTYAYIQALNNANYCGYNDWRMPTLEELQSIIDYGRNKPTINPIFSHTPSTEFSLYWSSSPAALNDSDVWGISFGSGYSYTGPKTNNSYIRAVRSNK